MIRSSFALAGFCLIVAGALIGRAAWADVVRLSDPVETTDTYETFGSPLPEGAEVISLGTVLENSAEYLDQPVLIRTRVAQVCQAKGCFFVAQEGAHAARVSFVDYSFFVPSDISGRTVTLAGSLIERELSEAQAAHLNDDVGAEAVRPGIQLEIVATSVRVPRQ